MLPRAEKILALITAELAKRDRAIEQDADLAEVKFIIRVDRRTGEPGRVSFAASSESKA